jgi:hypothetical protein
LAGRFERTYTAHRTFAEIEQAFDWNEDQYVWFGDYPRSNGLVEEEGPWKAYVQQSLIKASIQWVF